MTRLLPILLVAVLGAEGFVLPAAGQTERPPRFVVVVDRSAELPLHRAAAAVRAAERATGAEGELRVTRTPTEQLSVTHYFAAQGYETVIGVGLSVTPVTARFPGTRFRLTDERGLAAAARGQ